MTGASGNRDLASRARELADAAGIGIRRRALLVAAVALHETSSVEAARKVLDSAAIARDVIEAAHGILRELEAGQ